MSDIDPRVISAVDHVQKAAIELIAAMRNALDVAEDLVGDPTTLQTLIQGAVIAGKAVIDNVTTTTSGAQPASGERVERIKVD